MTHPTDDARPVTIVPMRDSVVRTALVVLAILAALACAVWAKSVLMPFALAIMLHLALVPLVRALKRIGVAPTVGGFLVVAALLGSIGWIIVKLSEPAMAWAERLPHALARLQTRWRSIGEPIRQIAEVSEHVENLGTDGNSQALKVAVEEPSWTGIVMEYTTELIVLGSLTALLLYFLLASEGAILRNLVRLLPRVTDKQRAVDTMHRLERDVTRYLSTMFGMSALVGVASAGAMAALGMPNPMLWGLLGMVLNWIPYLGAVVGAVIVGLVASTTFDGAWDWMLPPLVFYAITAIEGMLVTPFVLGRRLTLNPVLVLLCVSLGGWMWGVVGAFLAVPALAAVRIVSSKTDSLSAFGEFLGAHKAVEPARVDAPVPVPPVARAD